MAAFAFDLATWSARATRLTGKWLEQRPNSCSGSIGTGRIARSPQEENGYYVVDRPNCGRWRDLDVG